MLAKIAGIVLVGSTATLAVAGVAGWTNSDFHEWTWRLKHHFDPEHRQALREHAQSIREQVRENRAELRERRDLIRERAEHVRERFKEQARRRRHHSRSAHTNSDLGTDLEQKSDTYVFDASGNPFGKLPWSAHVELQLQDDGRYALRLRTDVNGEQESESAWGRYLIKGDRLLLYSGNDDEAHEFRIDGDRLIFDADWSEQLALRALGIDKTYMVKVK